MRDKKRQKKGANVFQAIMTTNAPPKNYDAQPCPKCGLSSNFVPPIEKDGRNLVVQFRCPNGHQASKYVMIKK